MVNNILSEDINRMMGLIGYDRGKTLTENKQQLHEVLPLIPLAVGGAVLYGLWSWGVDAWGSKNIDTAIAAATKKDTWPQIAKAIKQSSLKSGKDIEADFDVISSSEANDYASRLYDAFEYITAWEVGTDEDTIGDIMGDMGSMMDLARVADAYGTKSGGTLEYELDDELSQSDFKTYVSNPMRSKPMAIFDGRNYDSIEELVKAIVAKAEPEEKEKEGTNLEETWKKFPCVLKTIGGDDITYKFKNEEKTQVLIEIGNAIALFGNGGRFAYKGPDYKEGTEVLKGNYSCKGDELSLGGDTEELSLGEGILYNFSRKIKNNLLTEQIIIDFGDMRMQAADTKVPDETAPPEEKEERGINKCTFNQILEGKCTAQKGDKGPVIEEIQNKLIISEVPGTELSSYGADADFGTETHDAVIDFQKANQLTPNGVVEVETAKALQIGGVASGEDKKDEEEAVEVKIVKTGSELKVGDQLYIDSEDGVDVIRDASGNEYRTTDDLEKIKFNRQEDFKKIKTDKEVIKFDRDGNIKKIKKRKPLFRKNR